MTPSKSTVIIGINPSHNASAALMVDDTVVAACQEERLSRIKNHIGLPILAVKYCLDAAGLRANEVDYVVITGITEGPFYLSTLRDIGVSQPAILITADKVFRFLRYRVLHWFAKRMPILGWIDYALSVALNKYLAPKLWREYKKLLVEKTGLDELKISSVGHHEAHISFGYFGSGFAKENKPTLGFTLDGGGDGITSTVWYGYGGKLKLKAKTIFYSSIGYLYMYTTYFMGLKPTEDEYKVMGLAPYAPRHLVEELVEKLREFVQVDKKKLVFKSKVNTNIFYQYMPELYNFRRFDVVAAAIQQITEERICELVGASLDKFKGVDQVVTGGGVFANIKVNQKIAQLPLVKKAYFTPSPGDETNSIGACYWKFKQIGGKRLPSALKSLYLGPDGSKEDIKTSIDQAKSLGYKISLQSDVNQKVANLLKDGGVVARFSGRMEFGARALGNRSILADASRVEVKDIINKLIKSRDFWMPFAPTVLYSFREKYFVNTKNVESKYMMVTFETTPLGRRDLAAAVHPYDKTARAQLLKQEDNDKYYDLLLKFYDITGRYGLLNTSFNLHGEPIVCTPEDALGTFKKSGLKYLQLEDYLISKV